MYNISPEQKFLIEALREPFEIVYEIGEGDGMKDVTRFVIEASESELLNSLVEEADKAWLTDIGVDPSSLV
jgi:hypothetical protein